MGHDSSLQRWKRKDKQAHDELRSAQARIPYAEHRVQRTTGLLQRTHEITGEQPGENFLPVALSSLPETKRVVSSLIPLLMSVSSERRWERVKCRLGPFPSSLRNAYFQ